MALWLEVDIEGRILRQSDEMEAVCASFDPPLTSLERVLPQRPDLQAAVLRQAGHLRLGLGHGPSRALFDVDVSAAARGARLSLRNAYAETDEATLGRLLLRFVRAHPDSTVLTDPDGEIIWCDPSFEALVGYGKPELVGRSFELLYASPLDETERLRLWRHLLAVGTASARKLLRRSDGVEIPVQISLAAISEEGRTICHVAMMHSASRDTELERLRRASAAGDIAGRLSASFAHRLNNLAAEIVGRCEAALLSEDAASAGTCIDAVLKLGADLGGLGQRMLSLSSGVALSGPTDLGQVAREMSELVWLLEGTPPTVCSLDAGPWIDAPAAIVHRVVFQLLLRTLDAGVAAGSISIEAMEEYGEPLLRIRYAPSSSERAVLRWLLPDGTVTGPMLNELWEYTRGSGLRLYHEEIRDGTVAICLGGRAASRAESHPPARTNREAHGHRVIVVEDNVGVREVFELTLSSLFDEVVTLADGGRLMEEVAGGADLVVLDLRLPGRDGVSLLRELQEKWPDLPVIVVSGGAPEAEVRSATNAGARAVLAKPFLPSELRMQVARILS